MRHLASQDAVRGALLTVVVEALVTTLQGYLLAFFAKPIQAYIISQASVYPKALSLCSRTKEVVTLCQIPIGWPEHYRVRWPLA